MHLLILLRRLAMLAKLLEDWMAGRIPKKTYDTRWAAFAAKIFCFPQGWEHYKNVLRIIGEEDNLNLLTRASLLERFVTCRAIFLEYFAHLQSQVWRDKTQLSEYVKMCLVHAEPRNEIQARILLTQ